MGKWTTPIFITKFMKNELGRKRVHGTCRVLEGDHCKLLVRATTEYGRPAGNELIAINLSTADYKMVFWQEGYNRSFTYRLSRQLPTDCYQALPSIIMTGGEDGILNSGIIEVSDTHALIEIGDKPFLLHRAVKDDGDAQTVMLLNTDGGCPLFEFANQIPTRVGSIKEAKELVKEPVGERRLVGAWWAKEMPFGFIPPAFEPEYVKTLAAPLNPLDFGFEMDECRIGSIQHSTQSMRVFLPKKKVVDEQQTTGRVQKWNEAVAKWEDAANKFLCRTPIKYKGISTSTSRFSYGGANDTCGELIVTGEGVYVTGTIHNENAWHKEDNMTQWYKLTQPANQIMLSKCS